MPIPVTTEELFEVFNNHELERMFENDQSMGRSHFESASSSSSQQLGGRHYEGQQWMTPNSEISLHRSRFLHTHEVSESESSSSRYDENPSYDFSGRYQTRNDVGREGHIRYPNTQLLSPRANSYSEDLNAMHLSGKISSEHRRRRDSLDFTSRGSRTIARPCKEDRRQRRSTGFQPFSHMTSKSTEAQPLRPLSAYNYFFLGERNLILNGGSTDWSQEHCQALLLDHWTRDRSTRRSHRKSHGQISFGDLTKIISKRWRETSEEGKDFYKRVAKEDMKRYQAEL